MTLTDSCKIMQISPSDVSDNLSGKRHEKGFECRLNITKAFKSKKTFCCQKFQKQELKNRKSIIVNVNVILDIKD